MRVLALVAALLLLPAVEAGPFWVFGDGATGSVLGGPDDPLVSVGSPGEGPVLPPLPTVFMSQLCYWSSEVSFCTGDLPGIDSGQRMWINETLSGEGPGPVAEAVDDPGTPFIVEETEPKGLTTTLETSEEGGDPGAPGPRGPGPESGDPPAPAAGAIAPAALPERSPAMQWAVLTAAVALPWALGLKVLATLLGMRRAGRAAVEAVDRPTLRSAVLEAVSRQPGIRHSDLVACIGRGNGTVEHHVSALMAEGLVERRRGLGSTIYFPAGALGEAEARMRLALQGGTSRRMAQAIADRPGIRLGDLARDLGISGATAHYQAGKLVRAGVVREEPGAGRRFAVEAHALPVVAGLAPGPTPAAAQGQPWVPDATAA